MRVAVEKNQNAALSTALLKKPPNKNAPFCNARVSHVQSDAAFEAHILKAGRRLHTLDVVSQPSRTFESPRARRDAPNKRRSLLKRGCEFMTASARCYAPNERRRLRSTHFKGGTATSHLRRCLATIAHVRSAACAPRRAQQAAVIA